MQKREDRVRIDGIGVVHPIGRSASQRLRQAEGEWCLLPATSETLLLRRDEGRVLRLAGQIDHPGGLGDAITLIAQSRWRGELCVQSDAGTRVLYIENGHIVQGRTTVDDERIGELMYRFGVLAREDLDAVLVAAEQSGKRVGEMALELGLFSAEELYRMVARQLEEMFYGALYERSAVFYFTDDFDEQAIGRRFSLNAFGLLMEGARRVDELRYFREKIPTDSYIPLALGGRAGGGGGPTPPDELKPVLSLCDGRRSVADIGRETGLLEFEITRAVYQLMTGGYVKLVGARPEDPEQIVDAFNAALRAVHQACDAQGKGQELRAGLSRFATGGGVYDALFLGAGPLDDGTLQAERVHRNLHAFAGGDANQWLLQLMNDYVGFAVFQSESLLSEASEQALAERVSQLLKPLAPLLESGAPAVPGGDVSLF